MTRLRPLPKKITKEIRTILEGCRDGRLKHTQTNFHCGTAHCIAGWKEQLDYKVSGSKSGVREWIRTQESKGHFFIFSFGYAQAKWRLTDNEAEEIFGADQTFPEQFAMLERLERGERIPDYR